MLYLIIFLLLVNIAVSFKTLKSSTNMTPDEQQAFDKLGAEVAANTAATNLAVTAIGNLKTQLAAIAGNTDGASQVDAINALITQIDTDTANITAALAPASAE